MKKLSGRGADLDQTEDEPVPSRREPASMDYSAPLHTPYGTSDRTWEQFYGKNRNPMLERRPLMPSFVFAEHEWDTNPRESNLRASYTVDRPYEMDGSIGWAEGENIARSVDVRAMSNNRYASFAQKSNPTAYNADPIIGNGQGGMGPVLGPYIGKKGTPKPTVPDRPGIAGTSAGGVPMDAEFWLPGATRSNRTHSETGNITGGFVADYGAETINPYQGGRISNRTAMEEYTVWNASGGPIGSFGGEDQNPQEGGRVRMPGNFQIVSNAGGRIGVGSSLENNPQEGGRIRIPSNFQTIKSGGASSGVSGMETNDITGGNHWARTGGVAGRMPNASRSGGYGGEIAYGLEVFSKAHRTEGTSIMFAGASGRGSVIDPDNWASLPLRELNDDSQYDDTPDAALQKAARSTLGARRMLDFSRENLNELAIDVSCI